MELKNVIQAISSRNWRCHKRRIFFQKIFKELLTESECHNLAGMVPYYPFELIKEIPIGKVSPNFPEGTNATVYRVSPAWRLLFGFGEFGVTINNLNFQKKIWLW